MGLAPPCDPASTNRSAHLLLEQLSQQLPRVKDMWGDASDTLAAAARRVEGGEGAAAGSQATEVDGQGGGRGGREAPGGGVPVDHPAVPRVQELLTGVEATRPVSAAPDGQIPHSYAKGMSEQRSHAGVL